MEEEYVKCPECGASLIGVQKCRDYLNEMIKWDFEDFTGVGQVHPLTVLSYNLQHPSVYSKKGLENAKKSLTKFILHPTLHNEHGAEDIKNLASDVRKWKIISTVDNQGVYISKPIWEMTAVDVVREGIMNYVENVKKWSKSILKSLKVSGNLDELTFPHRTRQQARNICYNKIMKTLTCKDLGGPCDQKLTAESWDEMVQKMTKHVIDNHPDTANEMEKMHNEDPKKWGSEMKPKWDAAPFE